MLHIFAGCSRKSPKSHPPNIEATKLWSSEFSRRNSFIQSKSAKSRQPMQDFIAAAILTAALAASPEAKVTVERNTGKDATPEFNSGNSGSNYGNLFSWFQSQLVSLS